MCNLKLTMRVRELVRALLVQFVFAHYVRVSRTAKLAFTGFFDYSVKH